MVRGIALLLTVMTGFTALVYEVAWQKYLTVLLGSDSEATAAVLGIFLGGLSYGYGLFGKVARRLAPPADAAGRPARLLRGYGLVEAGIGAYALLFPFLFQAARAVSLRLPQGSEALAFAFDVALTVVLIGPPAVLMGGTIPLLTQALAKGLEDATRFHALVYAFNTLGAFGGALSAGFWLIPWLGLGSAIGLMGLLNLAAGVLFVALGGRGSQAKDPLPSAPDSPLPSFLAFALAALLAGFAMMTLQTVANRIGALALGASHFTFAMVVATFVLSIALGSFAVTAFTRIPRAVLPLTAWLMVGYLLALDSQIPNAPYWAHVLRARFPADASGFYPFHFGVLVALLAILALPLALSGATLPLIFDHLRRRVSDLGLVAGRLYSWNTVGSLLGALLGGYALFFWLDLQSIYRLALLAIAAAGGILTASVLNRRRWLGGVGFAVVAAVLASQPAWSPGRLSAGLFRERELLPTAGKGPEAFFEKFPKSQDQSILFHEDDPSITVTVRDRPNRDGRVRSIINNGKSDSAIPTDKVTMGLLALIPSLLAEKAERSFVIGYGTGWTVGELAALESMQKVVVAEISKGVLDAAPLFDEFNRNASSGPKTRIIRSDAYRALSREEGSYDVIVSEPSNPWTAGVELLYTREFLETARERLAPGGVHAQWMHAYEMDDETLGIVLRTYREVFEGVGVWFARGTDLILLGFEDPGRPTDLPRIEERFQRQDFRQQFATLGIRSFHVLLGHELLPVGVLDAAELPFEIHTVLHPILSDRAARAFYEGALASLPFAPTTETARAGAEASLLRRLRAARGRPPTARERLAVILEICRYRLELCAAHIAEWQHQEPGSRELAQLVAVASQSGDHAELMQPELRETLAAFLGDGDPSSLEPASQATFIEYYSYSAPFDIGVLESLRSRCSADPSCAEKNGAP